MFHCSSKHQLIVRKPKRLRSSLSFVGLCPLYFLVLLTLVGCDPNSSNPEVESIEIRGQNRFQQDEIFFGAPGKKVGPLRVQVLGPVIQGVTGRHGRRDPVSGVDVTFRFKYALRIKNEYADSVSLPQVLKKIPNPTVQESSQENPLVKFLPHFIIDPQGSDAQAQISDQSLYDLEEETDLPEHLKELKTEVVTLKTNAHGFASIDVQLGQYVGEFRVEAEINNQFEQPRTVDFWLISGLELLKSSPIEREGPTGSPNDIAVKVYKNVGLEAIPEKNRAVYFTPVEIGQKQRHLSLEKTKDRSNSDGIAKVDMAYGTRAGQPHILIELEPTLNSASSRSVTVEHYIHDPIEFGLFLLGGLGLFLIGLRFISGGLLTRLSPQLRLATSTFAKNNVLGFLGGTAIGATFLSSSTVVTRLMIFANSGLLLAKNTAGQILGVHFGKSLLIQILAFDGIIILGAPLTAIGALLSILPGKVNTRAWGSICLGLGVVILGWQFLLYSADLAQVSPSMTAFIQSWDPANHQLGGTSSWMTFGLLIFFALIFTALVGNSSLIVVIGMACVGKELTSAHTVIAFMVGGHLGSCSTVLIRSLKRNREARRVALTHTLFYVFGSIWLIALTFISPWGQPLVLQLVDWVVPGRFFEPSMENVEHHIAMTYTLYHFVNGIPLLLMSPLILKWVKIIVPRDPINDDLKPYRLDPSLIDVPSLALEQTTNELVYLIEVQRKNLADSYDAFKYQDLNLVDQIARREEMASNLQKELTLYLLQLTNNRLAPQVAARLQSLQSAAGYLPGIARQGEFIRELAGVAQEEGLKIPESVIKDLDGVYELMMEQFENILNLLKSPTKLINEKAIKLGERLARSTTRIETGWFKRVKEKVETDESQSQSQSDLAEILGRDAYTNLIIITRSLADIADRMRVLESETEVLE